MPAGYTVSWSGQYEYLQRARQRLQWVVPATLVIIFGLIFLVFRRASEAAIIMVSLPLAHHWPHVETPNEFLQALRSFLEMRIDQLPCEA